MQITETGRKYEQIVCDYLVSRGMEIVDRNYTVNGGEIDVIAIDGNYICFIEVKYRSIRNMDAYSSIGYKKQKRLIKTAERYLYENEYDYQPRFDAVFVFEESAGISLDYIKNAYDASY